MKQLLRTVLIFTLTLSFSDFSAQAQCPSGYTRDTLNWDYLDYLPNSADYSSYVTLPQSQTQRFSFGTQKITIAHNYTGANIVGENADHTGQAGSFGNGQHVEFTGNGIITLTFADTVQNLQFSLYDVDRSQNITITANNGVSPSIVSLSTLAGTLLTITNNNTSTASATASNTSAETTSIIGTLNVSVPGPVTGIVITISNTQTANGNGKENGSFWLSDISACSEGVFPADYYAVSRPYTNQPSYVIIARNDSVYYVDVATGKAKFIFADYGHNRINSVAYDPYRHFIYYTYSLTGPGGDIGNNRTLRRYDYDMDTLGIVANDARTLGIPLYDYGVESGAAAFYDGSLYLGIEAGSSSSREATIWKIDFTPQFAPSGFASQVFATDGAAHDWADFGISNGILYDFDGRASNTDFYHKNLLTGSVAHYDPSPNSLIPRQTGVDWNGVLYNMGSSSSISAATVVPYNNNGSVNTTQEHDITFNGTVISGSWGDAAEAFKPKTDFGDAPASYDPGAVAGTHEKDPLLRLGATTGIEWTKRVSANATGDGAEEDALNGFQVIATGSSNFLLPVSVYNNTGAPATLAGWIDANGDGQFQTTEGRSITVASNTAQQTIMLQWYAINVTLPANTTTFLRLRLTSASNGMTTANPTGFFLNGEIEDHTILTTLVLPDQNITLQAQKQHNSIVGLSWKVSDESNIKSYLLQRSGDAVTWKSITEKDAVASVAVDNYAFTDKEPLKPFSYYRVKAMLTNGGFAYSESRKVEFNLGGSLTVSPNPVKSNPVLAIQSVAAGIARINILDNNGRVVLDQTVKVGYGANELNLPIVDRLSSGIYKVRVLLNDEVLTTTMIVVK